MSDGLRVCLVTPEYPGCGPAFGVGTYVRTLARALREAGAEPRVLVCAAEGRFTIEDEVIHRCGDSAGSGMLRPLLNAGWLERAAAEHRARIIEYPNWAGLGAWVGGTAVRVVRLCTPLALIPARTRRDRLTRPIHHWWEDRSVRRAQRIIADSTAMADLAAAHYGRRCDAIIPHAYSGAVAAAPAAGNDLIAVGRLEPRKGTDVLVTAWARIRDRHPGVRLHLVGSDSGFGARHVARVGDERIVLHGRIDEQRLADLRRSCRLEILASRFESFGLVVLEAWASGLAVLATRAGALPEVLGDAGELVPPEDPEALAEALHRLLTDPGACPALARSGLRALGERFTAKAYAEATLATYRDALSAASCPRA